jgi:AcrR family transcriptional regulator
MLGEGEARSGRVERRRAATRREIVEAAWELCREQGLAGLSLRRLAARVGMRAPSLYSYFPSKDAIYDAMFAQGYTALAEQLAFLPEEATRADVRAGAAAFFAFCTADPVRYLLLFQRTIPGFEPSEQSYGLAVEVFERMRRQLRSAGMDDDRHLDLWTAMLTGLTAQQLSNDPDGDRWGRLLDEAVDLLLDHAGVPGTRPARTPSKGAS